MRELCQKNYILVQSSDYFGTLATDLNVVHKYCLHNTTRYTITFNDFVHMHNVQEIAVGSVVVPGIRLSKESFPATHRFDTAKQTKATRFPIGGDRLILGSSM